MLGDLEIRQAIHTLIRDKRPSSIILDELKVCGKSIVDIAVLGSGLIGIEIKSDKDTLNRLPNQIEDYNKVFDFMDIVLGKNHYEKAMKLLPDWWGVWIAETIDGEVVLTQLRKGKRNRQKDNFSLSQFLWREEALEIMIKEGIANGMKTKRKWILWDKMANSLSTDSIFSYVKQTLLSRYQNESWKNQLIIE